MHQKLNIREEKGRIVEKIYDYEVWWPKMPPKTKIEGYHLPTSKQKFTRTPYPKTLYRPRRDDNGNIIYSLEEKNWVNTELQRIVDGYWFYNNGQPTYITGYHYLELNYWKIDVGLKEYRDRDRRFHLVWQFCEDDPDCYGLIYMKHRREGATHRACVINFLTAILHPGVMNGIQSKTNKDAQKIFQKKLVPAWRGLRPFLQPIFEGTTNPKSELSFSEPAEKIGKTTRRVKSSNALDSSILFGPTVDTAFDGDKLKFHHLDECGKTVEMDVYDCWNVIRECLTMGNKITGKCLATSTVEEMTKKGGANFKRIWKESDYTDKSENNRTASGLYRLFFAAYDGLEGFLDEYGYSMKEEAKAYLNAEIAHKKEKGDQAAVSSFKRKYPQNEGDALLAAVGSCEFNLEKLQAQREYLLNLPENKKPYIRGNFMWQGGERDTRVIFVPKANGRWKVAYRFHEDESELSNKVKIVGHSIDQVEETTLTRERPIYKPDNTEKFCLGVDPYNIDRVKTGRGSDGGGYVFKKFDLAEEKEEYQKIFACQYLYRPPKAEDFFEDMLMTCVYYGCQMLFEENKQRIRWYFEQRRYQHFLMVSPITEKKKRDKNQAINKLVDTGQSANRDVTQQIGELWEAYIEDNWDKIPFEELIEDLIEFDPFDTQKSDATMSSGYALIASKKYVKKRNNPNKKASSILPMYKHTGLDAKIIKN